MTISIESVVNLLKSHDNIILLTHQNPDGDTIGSAYALFFALKQIGKKAKVLCSDKIPSKYHYFTKHAVFDNFDSGYIVSVDIADTGLFGEQLMKYKGSVNVCIDHHPSNSMYAEKTFLVADAAATCEIIYDVIRALGAEITPLIADCIYTGITTDTGCFRYSNVTAKTHQTAANLIADGANSAEINRIMFETKSKSRILLEQMALNSIEYFYNERCAVISVTTQMIAESGADESDLDGISPIPRQIEGVEVGVTIRQKGENLYKISLRTSETIDASEICREHSGGGHKRAAGCTVHGTLEYTKQTILDSVKKYLV